MGGKAEEAQETSAGCPPGSTGQETIAKKEKEGAMRVFLVILFILLVALILVSETEAQGPVVWDLSYNWRPVLIGVICRGVTTAMG